MDNDKSQDLQGQLESWRPGRTNLVFSTQAQRPENQESQLCSSNLKAAMLETQEEPMFSVQVRRQIKSVVQFEGNWARGILS